MPDLQITRLDNTGTLYLVDVTTAGITAAAYRSEASKEKGAGARKAEQERLENISPNWMEGTYPSSPQPLN